ncbi:MAG TPA: translocation/assembly module TamB domain-containing protein, partial [Candidatus Krumholzibacteria bacterium]
MDDTPIRTDSELAARRRVRLRRRISYAIAIVLTAVIAGIGVHQLRLLPRRLSTYVNDHYLRGTNFVFSVDGVSGFFVRHIKLTNPVLRYQSRDASYNVFRADEISVEYDLMPVFAFRLIVTDLTMKNVAIHLRQDEQGKLVLPMLPKSPGKKSKLDVSPVVNVRNFAIDGLEMQFGGLKRELGVRDVHLDGAFEYADGKGHLIIDDGGAYLVDSKKTVQSIRLDAHGDASSLDLDDFAVKLDESFVIARGGFRDGTFDDVNVVVNPISLPELHQLGLIGDEKGEFSGHATLNGTVDSLGVEGELSGAGLGVELAGMKFKGTVTPKRLALANMNGAVFGATVNGRFDLDIDTEDFVYDGHIANLDLGRGFITDDEIPPMSLNGNVHVRHFKKQERFDFEGVLDRAVVDGFEAFDVAAKGTQTEATGIQIERASLRRPGFRAEANGTVDPENVVDMVFKVDATDLTYFWEHFKLPPVGGASNLNGRIHGPIDDFTVNVNGPFTNLEFEPALVDSGTVTAEARHIGTLDPGVSVAVQGRRGSISGQWFESPIVHVEIDTSHVEIRNARFARGDTSIVADLDVKAKGKNATIDVRRVVVSTPSDVWTTTHPSVMHVEPGSLYVDSLVIACPRGELGGDGAIRPDSKTLDFDAWGKGIDLTVVRDVAKLPFRLNGNGDFRLGLSGRMDDPRGRLEITIREGVVDSVAFDQMTARAEFDGSGYRVDHLQVVAGKDTVSAEGSWMSSVSPVQIANKERPRSLWKAPLKGRLGFEHFPLATVFEAMHTPSPVAAAFDGALELGGTLESPTAHLRGAIVPAAGEGREFPPAEVDIRYEDNALRVAQFNTTDGSRLRLTGTFPLAFSFEEGARVEEDRPLEFKLEITPKDNEPIEIGRFIDGVSLLRGVVSANVAGSGTPASPRLSGNLAFTRGELRVVGLEEDFRDIAMRVDFIDDVVRLTSLSAKSGKKGSLVASGWSRMSNYRPADYKLDLTVRDLQVNSIPDIEIQTDGNLSVKLVDYRNGRRIPKITGRLAVKEAEITMDITQTSGGTASAEFTRPTDSPNWLASVDLDADKNVWIRNQDLTVELEGDLILNRDERGLYFRGDMSILRGSYYVAGNKFEITDGTFDFSASETLRPSMQINAYTPFLGDVNNPSGAPSSSSDDNIYLALSWPYDQKEPRIKLSYEGAPGYSDAEIWNMLGRNTIGAGVATNALQRVIDSQMTGGVDVQVGQRRIDPKKSETETTVGLQKYLWQDIYLRYQRGFSTQSEQEVSVE